ncbi:MAG TPA: MIP family channel protein [Symbiobacteriaceae bacterium]|nr:MIP family channel protein [Symbiobacteriaceae bacterium]
MRRALVAEFLGTFGLVFAGTGAVVFNQMTGALTHVGIAIVFGLIVTAMIYTFGHTSGAHFNPAVTLGFASIGAFPWRRVPGYLAVQILGAVAASGVLRATFGLVGTLGATLPATTPTHSFVLELILTFFLMLVIMGAAVDAKAVKGFAGLAIGATVGLEAMFGGPISGASMNPVRSFGPALVAGAWAHHWLYWVAPILGALLAAFVYRYGVASE